ncbi:hypothetical protein ACFO5Q_03695 [Kordiimonas lipolytica]|uniref:Membrane domain of glycerophosphoryl diester phosphodiesterase n=1 Tax=Kordiimonas lipolytica TaxID=1662421 RepID=A0ABV8U6W9_9PROT|nr:hypothetical protein [Kordiimonas lipolytica]
MTKLPIIQIVSHALKMPLSAPAPYLKAIGLLVGVVALFIGALIFVVDASLLQAFQEIAQQGTGDPNAMAEHIGAMGSLFLIALIFGILMLLATSHLFNVGVRVGAYGKEGARFGSFGEAMGAAGVNSLKFFFIGILLVIVSIVIIMVFAALGLGPSFAEQAAAGADLAESTRATLMNNIIVVIVSCVVYSLFSANLTQTALRSDKEGMSHPHTVDFAIVLVLLYAIVLVPVTLAGLAGSMVLMQALNVVLGLVVAIAIGTAHGIRYRICMAENEQKVFE